MKKLITVLVCLLFFVQLSAQQFLVPFVFNGKMGLQNEKGKTILPARFDHIDWVTDHYFETSTAIRLDDTLLVEPRQLYVRHEDSKLMGLVYQGKEILKAEPFDDYYILPKKFILAKTEKRIWKQTAAQVKRYGGKEKFSALFSLAGKNMYPENFRRLQVLDTTGKSNRYPGYSRYVLLVTEDFDKKNALIVFDADRQEIVDWLLKDASKLEIERDDFRERNAIRKFSYVDREYEKRVGIVDARSGKFVFTNYAAPASKKM